MLSSPTTRSAGRCTQGASGFRGAAVHLPINEPSSPQVVP